MRSAIFIPVIIMCHFALSGQSAEDKVISMKQKENSSLEELPVTEKSRPSPWNLSVGTSYSYMKGFGSGMMFYAAPTYTISLNNRWAVHGGMIATRYQGLNSNFSGETSFPNSFSSIALFTAASYQMSDRLVFHGTGVKQLISAPVTPFMPYPVDNLSLGASYRLGNNITIGASIHLNNGQGYYSTPFYGTMFRSPHYW
jgi:hypothetical protein